MTDVSLTGHIEITHAKDMGGTPGKENEKEKRLGRYKNKWICSKTMGKSTNF